MASPERALVSRRAPADHEWDEQVAELIGEGLLTDELESALHVVAGIIAAEPRGCQPRQRRTELAVGSASRIRHTVVHLRPR